MRVLIAARWCFLNFGFGKTTFDDIAKRAGLSRTLLYRMFKDKQDIYGAVFVDWLLARRGPATEIANGPGTSRERLISVCRLMVLEPWAEMIDTAMGSEFLAACARIDPEIEAIYRKVLHGCVATIFDDDASAEIFLLALNGMLADRPSAATLERRTKMLAIRFAPPVLNKEARS